MCKTITDTILVHGDNIIINEITFYPIPTDKVFRYTKNNIPVYIKPGYFISVDGNIVNVYTKQYLNQYCNNNGYYNVSLQTTEGRTLFAVHRLILLTFRYPSNINLHINHVDGNKNNNSLDNLEWVTISDNTIHARYNNMTLTGEDCPWSKLTEKDVREICELFSKKQNTTFTEVAKKYGVSKNAIRDIITGYHWKDISLQYNIKYDKRAFFSPFEAHFICSMMEKHNDKGFEYIYYLIIYFMNVENTPLMRKRIYKIWNKESFVNISAQYHFNE